MTFKELADLRGISKLSAVSLVRRHGWRRQRDNQGHVRALVPVAWAVRQPDNEPVNQADNQADTKTYAEAFETALSAIEAAHAGELTALRGERDAAKAAEADARVSADRALAQVADIAVLAQRAEAALAGKRSRADGLRDRLDAAKSDADQAREQARTAEERAEALRRANEARKARGLLARLSDAVRGR